MTRACMLCLPGPLAAELCLGGRGAEGAAVVYVYTPVDSKLPSSKWRAVSSCCRLLFRSCWCCLLLMVMLRFIVWLTELPLGLALSLQLLLHWWCWKYCCRSCCLVYLLLYTMPARCLLVWWSCVGLCCACCCRCCC